ncbi:choice-of-anchor Q domain-containing protein [Methylotetracoccus oryzae]|uniref:choice-of-anchor Q domain-containing protein n=1 Tax=Methylotetracoccus oryzae TaxID=1919059 RepID=UPI00111B5256|nr:choice-of-anchor Q domain-containing protein [Methylotetracoccus oryzae]
MQTTGKRVLSGPSRWRRRPLAAAVAWALSGGAGAATIAVDGSDCTLRDALTAANTDEATGGCAAGSGADTLALSAPIYTLDAVDNAFRGSNGLPVVSSVVTIDGDPDGDGRGTVIRRSRRAGTPEFRILAVGEAGDLTVRRVSLRNGVADLGGGLYNTGAAALLGCMVTGNQGVGIANDLGKLALRETVVSGNAGVNGGGISNRAGDLTLRSSAVTKNDAVYGGGIRNASGSVTLVRSELTENHATYDGGGLYNFNGDVTLTDSTVSGNSAVFYGGGIQNPEGKVLVTDSTIAGNSAKYGGGLLNLSRATVSRSTVSDNEAVVGGGLLNNLSGVLKIQESTVTRNTATDTGGGLVNGRSYRPYPSELGGKVTVTASTFTENEATYNGGAIQNWDGTMTVVNSTLSGNRAGNQGGAIYNSGYFWQYGSLTVRNSTLTGNRAGADGGGLFMYWGGTITLSNTLIARNKGPGSDCSIRDTDYLARNFEGVNLIADGSCDVLANGGISGDPKLGRLRDNGGPTLTHALRAGSPAIDAADAALCPKTDQRGITRPPGAACDIGAFERVETPAMAVVPLVSALEQAASAENGSIPATERNLITHQ